MDINHNTVILTIVIFYVGMIILAMFLDRIKKNNE